MLLILSREDYFPAANLPIAVAERMPQPSFPPHRHEFSEIVIVWRGNGLHVLNDRPWLVTCGDLFYIHDQDRHSYDTVNDLVLDNILYCRDRFRLELDWSQLLPPQSHDAPVCWRLTTRGMSLARSVIVQLERESRKTDPLSIQLSEALFLQLTLILRRHSYAADRPWALPEGEQLDLLMSALQSALTRPFDFSAFCQRTRAETAFSPANRYDRRPLFTSVAALPGEVSAAYARLPDQRSGGALRIRRQQLFFGGVYP